MNTPRSLYHLFKKVNSGSNKPEVHTLCGKGQDGQQCFNCECKDTTGSASKSTFLELPIDDYVKEMFERYMHPAY